MEDKDSKEAWSKRSSGALRWYASGGGIRKAGPFTSEQATLEAFRLAPAALARQQAERGTDFPYACDFRAWEE